MTAPEHRSTGMDANARGILVLVCAVAVGLLLLAKAGGGGGDTKDVSTSKKSSTSTTVTIDQGSGSTTSSTEPSTGGGHTPSEVKVLVLNGSGKAGVAASTSQSIGQTGYTMLTPGNAAANATTTSVYYAAGYEVDAGKVATVLGKTADVVKAKPATTLGVGSDTANVIVVLGSDVAPASTTSTTSGSSTGSTTSTTTG